MKKRYILLLLILVPILYLCFYPVPIDPQIWEAPPAPALEGEYAPNDYMSKVERIFEGQCHNCEDVAIDTLGRVYGGQEDGKIMRFDLANKKADIFADTKGRPLGMHFDSLGNLIVADANKGLLSINPAGEITVLVAEHGGKPFLLTDDLEIAKDGMIYFTDASWKFSFEHHVLDFIEHGGTGRFFSYNPATKETKLIKDNLYFANGVAVSDDQTFVLVNETGEYRVNKYWLEGPKKGQWEVFKENLPGLPDGISSGTNGIFWLTLITPRQADTDELLKTKFMRKLIVRLPESLHPAQERYAFILGLDAEGNVVHNLQNPNGDYAQIASVEEFEGKLYLGSLGEKEVGLIDVPK